MNNPKLPGGSNAVNAAGGSHAVSRPDDASHGTRNDSKQDPEAAFEGTRHISQAEAKESARDEVGDGHARSEPPKSAGWRSGQNTEK